jgi:hypothetical protein
MPSMLAAVFTAEAEGGVKAFAAGQDKHRV